MQRGFCSFMGVFGAVLSYFFGGVDQMFIVLCVFLAIDYISGIIVALVFKNSSKTKSGKLNSAESFKGLCKKCFVLILVGMANLLDIALGVDFIRAGVIIAFLTNESISIIENAGLMGIPIPSPLRRAIDILQEKGDNYEKEI